MGIHYDALVKLVRSDKLACIPPIDGESLQEHLLAVIGSVREVRQVKKPQEIVQELGLDDKGLFKFLSDFYNLSLTYGVPVKTSPGDVPIKPGNLALEDKDSVVICKQLDLERLSLTSCRLYPDKEIALFGGGIAYTGPVFDSQDILFSMWVMPLYGMIIKSKDINIYDLKKPGDSEHINKAISSSAVAYIKQAAYIHHKLKSALGN